MQICDFTSSIIMNVADTKMCVCVCYITLYTSVLVQFILAVAGAFNMYNTIVMSVTDNSVLSVQCTTYYTRLHISQILPQFHQSPHGGFSFC